MAPGGDQPSHPTEHPAHRIDVAGVIERADNHVLIVLLDAADATARRWQFPRGAAKPGESPEAAMRRVAMKQLGMEVEIVVGQPPLFDAAGGDPIELRYFFCGVIKGEPGGDTYAETRWVLKGRLREYEFEPVSGQVVDWLLDS